MGLEGCLLSLKKQYYSVITTTVMCALFYSQITINKNHRHVAKTVYPYQL